MAADDVGEELRVLRALHRAVADLDTLMLFAPNNVPGQAPYLGHRVEVSIGSWDELMDALGDVERFDLDRSDGPV